VLSNFSDNLSPWWVELHERQNAVMFLVPCCPQPGAHKLGHLVAMGGAASQGKSASHLCGFGFSLHCFTLHTQGPTDTVAHWQTF
jgi:hypothetical protein